MHVEHEGLGFDHPGHATVRFVTGGGTVVYIDPWRDVLDGSPGDADVVFVTHDDFDHYDPDGIAAVSGPDTTVVAFDGIDTGGLDREVEPLALGEGLTVADLSVRAVPAYNHPDGEHVDADGEPFHAEGEVVGLVIDTGGVTVYFPSDTDFLDGHRDIRADVFIPPIGGTYTMDGAEAIEFARSLDATLVLPVHYGTFDAIQVDAEAFAAAARSAGFRVELF